MRQNDSFNAKIVIGSFVRLVKIVKKVESFRDLEKDLG